MEKRSVVVGGIVALAAAAAVVRTLQTGGGPQSGVTSFAAAPPNARVPARPAENAPPQTRIVVFVAGEVRRPGLYRLAASARADDAVRAAGGASPNADPVAVNLAERLSDGEELIVPARGAELHLAEGAAPPARRGSALRASQRRRPGSRGRKAPPSSPIDVNAADATALQSIPGIGPRLAERIVEFRESSGPFASADELLDVNGVSERLVDKIAPYVVFGRR